LYLPNKAGKDVFYPGQVINKPLDLGGEGEQLFYQAYIAISNNVTA